MDHLTVKEALPVFYADYKWELDGGVNDSAVKIELLKGVFIFIPNFEARKKVVLKHDIHHLVTGYTAMMKGESEISAWELSTGCRHNWVAFTINTYGMMSGLPFNLRGIWKAWLRGKRSKNLYYEKYNDEELKNQTVKDLRKELGLLEETKPKGSSFEAFLSFVGFLAFGIVFCTLSVVLIPLVFIYSLSISIRKLWKKS